MIEIVILGGYYTILLKSLFDHYLSLFQFHWQRITNEGSIPEVRIRSISFIKSDLKWCIHLSRSLYLYFMSKIQHTFLRHFYDTISVWPFFLSGSSCPSYSDIIILMDESGSVGYNDYQKMKSFVAGLVKQFVIGPNRFSVITFESGAYLRFSLNSYYDTSSLRNAIMHLDYRSGGTNIASALRVAKYEIRYNSRNVPKIVLLITDGWSNGGEKETAQELKNNGAIIFCIGVGSGVNVNLLKSISSSSSYTTIVQSFDLLLGIQSSISSKTCSQSK